MSATDVHLAGPVRPFAVCGSFDAGERHARDLADVTCLACLYDGQAEGFEAEGMTGG